MRSKSFGWFSLLMFCSTSVLAMPLYSLKAGEFAQQKQAQEYRQKLAETMDPVFVEPVEGGALWQVLVGHFESKAEAWVFQQKASADLAGCSIKKWDWDGRALQFDATLPVNNPFEKEKLLGLSRAAQCKLDYESRGDAPAKAKAALQVQSIEQLDAEGLYQRGDWAKTNAEGIEALESLIQKYPKNALVNQAKLRLVRRYMGRQDLETANQLLDQVEQAGSAVDKARVPLLRAYCELYSPESSSERSYQAFCQVACDSQAREEDRIDAMLRAAALAHKMRNYPNAWLAFSQLEQTVDSPKIIAYARMQKAGLAFELVGRDVGSWEDVRALCDKVTSMDGAPRQVKSTAALMAMETFYQQCDYQVALFEAERLIEDYADCRREWALARVWTGVIQEMLGNKTEALEIFEALYKEVDFEYPKYSFKGNNIRAMAAYRAAILCEDDSNRRDDWIGELKTNYPDSKETRSIEQRYAPKGGAK